MRPSAPSGSRRPRGSFIFVHTGNYIENMGNILLAKLPLFRAHPALVPDPVDHSKQNKTAEEEHSQQHQRVVSAPV